MARASGFSAPVPPSVTLSWRVSQPLGQQVTTIEKHALAQPSAAKSTPSFQQLLSLCGTETTWLPVHSVSVFFFSGKEMKQN